jgi:hypothetical protein
MQYERPIFGYFTKYATQIAGDYPRFGAFHAVPVHQIQEPGQALC